MISDMTHDELIELIAYVKGMNEYRRMSDADVLMKLLSKVPGAEHLDHIASGKPLKMLVEDPEATRLTGMVMNYLIGKACEETFDA